MQLGFPNLKSSFQLPAEGDALKATIASQTRAGAGVPVLDLHFHHFLIGRDDSVANLLKQAEGEIGPFDG